MGVQKAAIDLTPGSPAVQPPAEIGVDPGDLVVPRHHGLGPMGGTELDPILRNLGITTIVGVGVSVNVGTISGGTRTNVVAEEAREIGRAHV